jgi:soluble lytic murein transglycosylase
MNLKCILTRAMALALTTMAAGVLAQHRADPVMLEMSAAYQKGDGRKLASLLPQTLGHPLEAQAAYWELKARLETASEGDIQGFLQRHAGQYLEDRLRNDWLLLLGRKKDWTAFAREYAQFRMRDDREVRCFAAHIELQQGAVPAKELRTVVLRNWYAQRDVDEGCEAAVVALYKAGHIEAEDIWRKARMGAESGRPRVMQRAVAIVAPDAQTALDSIQKGASKYLKRYGVRRGGWHPELTALAIIRLAATDLEGAVEQTGRSVLSPAGKSWVWAVLGKAAHYKTLPESLDHMRQARNEHLSDDLLAWKVRIMLREKQWRAAADAMDQMSDAQRTDVTWVYWKARCLMAMGSEEDKALARIMFENIASGRGFYEMLAAEELGRSISVPPLAEPLTAAEKEAARQNPGLQRALYAIDLGLRAEGVREWNYSTNLHTPGGMGDRELLAAADWACERQVWDRCINSSERTKGVFDHRQRFPMPLRDIVVPRSQEIGLDPAYVYGLIRQESRFIMDARSHVGASGLMQVMPATAKWTAKKIGMTNFSREMITDRDVNVRIGTGYLKLVLDDFQGSMPMAAAAYNAGPGRPRNWRNGPVLEAAIWAEGIPFHETRDYVKKVLANTTLYAAIITGQPQSLKKRLGMVGPRDTAAPEENKDLP